MALNNNGEFYYKTAKKTAWISVLVFLVVLNVLKFMGYVAVNPQKITAYQTPVDALAEFRHPLPMVLYYPLAQSKAKLAVVPEQKFFKYQQSIVKILRSHIKPDARVVAVNPGYCQVLQNAFADFTCSAAMNEQTLKHILSADDAVVILFRDFSEDAVPFENLAQDLNLRPQVLNVLNYEKPRRSSPTIETESRAVQEANLRNFAADYQPLLQQIMADNEDNVEKNAQNQHLFDRASVMVLACVPGTAECAEYANVPFTESVYAAVRDNLAKARAEWPRREIKVFLLSDFFAQDFASEEALLTDLTTADGVLLRENLRSGIMLPYFWRFYPEKKEFINQLKIKSGLSPDYWPKKMQIYYFRAVEIGKNEDF